MDSTNDMNTYKREVGRRLKAARVSAGLNQGQAADALGRELGRAIQDSRIGNYEQGSRLPDPITLQILCDLYGASPSAILGFTDAASTPDESALLKKYRLTDDRGKRAIQGVADSQPTYEMTPETKTGSASR